MPLDAFFQFLILSCQCATFTAITLIMFNTGEEVKENLKKVN